MSLTDTSTAAPRAEQETRPAEPAGRVVRAAIWFPGLAVAMGAAVATAHGLYEVAHAARVPAGIAWLYPLITDGLALVAYAATARLSGSAARYAWSVVILAAGLSGLAQASYLASDATAAPLPAGPPVDVVTPVFEASAALRFGVGAWPAVAAAIVAHLLYLLATDSTAPRSVANPGAAPHPTVQPELFTADGVQPERPAIQSVTARPVQPAPTRGVQRPAEFDAAAGRPALAAAPAEQPDRRPGAAPARDRAWAAATRHAHRHGALPTVSELEALAEVSRGTAAAVLKTLRDQPAPLHLITTSTEQPDDPTIEKDVQP